MSEQEFIGPYDHDRCHFCKSKAPAAYQRAEDTRPSGPFFDACEECAKVPYPQPKQFQQEAPSE